MRIDSLKLHNYRCFDKIEVHFHNELTVLVAPNGRGKTALLDALAVAFSPFVGKTKATRGKDFRLEDSHQKSVPSGQNQERTPAPFQVISLEAAGKVEGQLVEWSREQRGEGGRTTVKNARPLGNYAARLLERLATEEAPLTVLPLIAHYGTGRLWNVGPLGKRGKGKSTLPRNMGYEGCLASGSSYGTFSKWFGTAYKNMMVGRMQAQVSGQPSQEQARIEKTVENVRDAVRNVLAPYGDCWLDYDVHKGEIVVVREEDGRRTSLGLEQQSDGVQAITGLVGDIASRASLLNPQFGSEAAQRTPGIVLIDEVDMHLHPQWQQHVLESLRKAFPEIQFIVTTHSPQVLTTVKRESIRILSQDAEGNWRAESPPEQTKGVESAYLLATVMGVDPQPGVQETRDLHDYMALIEIGKADTPHARKLRSQLEEHFGENHPVILDCDRLIRFQSFKRERARTE